MKHVEEHRPKESMGSIIISFARCVGHGLRDQVMCFVLEGICDGVFLSRVLPCLVCVGDGGDETCCYPYLMGVLPILLLASVDLLQCREPDRCDMVA